MSRKLSGVIAAVPTPIGVSQTPDIELFLEHCSWALDNGCNALNILGTTGEANSLDLDARADIMRAAITIKSSTACLMVGTGTPSLVETIKLTQLAADLEYDAALILPPYYYKPVSDDGLFSYFAEIVRGLGDRDIGIYLYNFPQLTGIEFSVDLISRFLEQFPRHIKGMKDSSGNLEYSRKIASAFKGQFDVFPSSEACLPDAARDGFAGCISASVNLTAPLAAKVWQGSESLREEDCERLRQLRNAISAVPIVAAVKTLVAVRTGDSMWCEMIPPLHPLSDEQCKKMNVVAKTLGYL